MLQHSSSEILTIKNIQKRAKEPGPSAGRWPSAGFWAQRLALNPKAQLSSVMALIILSGSVLWGLQNDSFGSETVVLLLKLSFCIRNCLFCSEIVVFASETVVLLPKLSFWPPKLSFFVRNCRFGLPNCRFGLRNCHFAGCWLVLLPLKMSFCWLLGAGCWLFFAGRWLFFAGCWLLVAKPSLLPPKLSFCWLLVAGCWLLVGAFASETVVFAGCWLLVAGCFLLVAGCFLLVAGCFCWFGRRFRHGWNFTFWLLFLPVQLQRI